MKYTVENFEPVADQVLVQLEKPHKLNAIAEKRSEEAMEKYRKAMQEEGDYVFQPEDIIKEKVKIDAEFIVAKILKVGENKLGFEEGDYIVFRKGTEIPLDILVNKAQDDKCPVLVRVYEIKGKIINNDK